MDKKERQGKYWICSECAKTKAWVPPEGVVTLMLGLCGYCDREDETTLTPIVDFKRGSVEPIWD